MGLGEFAVNFFIALIALLDPIGNVPVFAAATSEDLLRRAAAGLDGRVRFEVCDATLMLACEVVG